MILSLKLSLKLRQYSWLRIKNEQVYYFYKHETRI